MITKAASVKQQALRSPHQTGPRQTAAKVLFRSLVLVTLILAILEGFARIDNGGDLPVLPYEIIGGVPQLPRNAALDVRFYDSDTVRYVTDDAGLRVHDSGPPKLDARRVFIAGDSQVLGYGFEFDLTFAARVSDVVFGDARGGVILGTPAMDPEILALAVDANRAALPADLPIAALALNLGNDLDEVFSAGGWYRGIDQPRLQSWLLRHSAAYMGFIQRRYANLTDKTLIPGINRIFYSTSPEERVLLLRETVDLMVATLNKIGADQSFIVIIPQDIQVFPQDFQKYRKYFSLPEDYKKWAAFVPQLAREFGLLETYAAMRMKRAGVEVVLLSGLLPAGASPEDYFTRTSHHLLPAAHELIAAEIIARAASGAPPL
ncbi:hypothetical protein [Parasedimentitalea maritima]|uniref:GDSL-like Lipase/Acylhydrolase family protein n=1 Tax=Parasedimentitalea maritima TaxID=2578117 RepID=A0A6A4RC22_9RHOB|nr:hypothetical protein [Zongyanglinia marina]KAE9624741.1 hypothetical protein GP644_23185 [Zongyanglinia marina]